MIKKCIFDVMFKQLPEDLESRAAKLIREASISEGAKVALISQNRRVAFAMLNALLRKNVNVDSILLRDEESYRHSHVRSYSRLCYMQKTMQSMRDLGIEYFVVMALSDKIPLQVVQGNN